MSIFDDLKNTKVGDVEAPPILPTGHYLAMFNGPWKEHKAKSGNVALRYPFRVVSACADVDADQLAAAGGIPSKKVFTTDFYLSPEALFRFTDFAKSMGVPDDLGVIEAAAHLWENPGEFMIECSHSPNEKNPDRPYVQWNNPTGELMD